MRFPVRLSPWCFLWWALTLLTVPLPWLFAAAAAAAIHEGSHLLALFLSGGSLLGLRIRPGGAVIDTGPLSPAQELCCALAGPVGSLMLLTLCHMFPRLALWGAVQGLFNLLPIYPLDGGRAIRCAAYLMAGKKPCKAKGIRVQ